MNKTTVISREDLEKQLSFCDKIRAYWHERDCVPKAYVETYGCQQNEADSEKIRGVLIESGYTITDTAEGADIVVMNTCAIREHAEQRVFGNLGALTHTKRRHTPQKIFLCGCMAGQDHVVQLSPCGRCIFHTPFVAVPGTFIQNSFYRQALLFCRG